MSSQLNFIYWTMGAWKSLELIREASNLKNKDIDILIFNSSLDNRFGNGKVASRLKIEKSAIPYDNDFNFYDYIRRYKSSLYPWSMGIHSIFIDEAQFLTTKQVEQLSGIVSDFNINVFCYGLKTNFKWELFEGSKRLLEISDNIREISSYCWCGRKATMNALLNEIIAPKKEHEEVEFLIGADELYTNVCYTHFFQWQLSNNE